MFQHSKLMKQRRDGLALLWGFLPVQAVNVVLQDLTPLSLTAFDQEQLAW